MRALTPQGRANFTFSPCEKNEKIEKINYRDVRNTADRGGGAGLALYNPFSILAQTLLHSPHFELKTHFMFFFSI
jgi:hypothetical protein